MKNIAYHKLLLEYKDDLYQNYWIFSLNNFLDVAILEWCKIFGNNSQRTHWTNYVDEDDDFRRDMLKHINISSECWESYWNDVKNYRDTEVAHHESNPDRDRYPDLEIALRSSIYLYQYLINELRVLKISDHPDDLSEHYQVILDENRELVAAAYNATNNLKTFQSDA